MEVLNYSETTFEKLPVTIFEKSSEGAVSVAQEIAMLHGFDYKGFFNRRLQNTRWCCQPRVGLGHRLVANWRV